MMPVMKAMIEKIKTTSGSDKIIVRLHIKKEGVKKKQEKLMINTSIFFEAKDQRTVITITVKSLHAILAVPNQLCA